VDVEDYHRAAGEEATPVLREQFGLDPRQLELFEMLVRKPLVRREQDDLIEFMLTVMRL
jgi:hypothetical protein